jgi:UDP:flavonoid glycosyltransferase YjiC (YdhE family)
VVIQHGGNNTLNETLYFGKAPLVMPFAWDGHDNAQRMNDTGHGIGMHRYAWSDAELIANIERLLTDPSIRERLARTSAHMRAHDGRREAARRIDALLRSSQRSRAIQKRTRSPARGRMPGARKPIASS